jgi:hypothetical protein
MPPLDIVPDPALAGMKPLLQDRLERLGGKIHAAEFNALLDPLLRHVLQRGFDEVDAHEGTVWLLDDSGQNLEPVFNTGPDADKFVGQFKQPLGSGLICMVFASEQPFLENAVAENRQQSKLLDARLQVETCAMIAVPFHFLHDRRGVISCVQLKRPGAASQSNPPGFKPSHLTDVQRTAAIFAQLLEFRLLSLAIGWSGE